SGRLNPKMGGAGVFPAIPQGGGAGASDWKPSADPAEHTRRSVYIVARRNLRFPFLEAFDPPDSNQSCPKRQRSTTAPQALALLNDRDVLAAAQGLAGRLQKEAVVREDQIRLVFRLALGRHPSAPEMILAQD